MKFTQRFLSWLLCCAMLMTSMPVAWAEEVVTPTPAAESSATATPAPAGEQGGDAAPVPAGEEGSDATPTPATEQGGDATPTPATEEGSDATPTPATEQGSDATPTPATDDGSDATPTPATEEGSDATPTPATEEGSDATPTPATEEGSDATPTPATVQSDSGASMPMLRGVADGAPGTTIDADPNLDLDPNPTTHTVTYAPGVNTAATIPQQATVAVGDPVTLPTLPSAGSYIFKGWARKDESSILSALTMPDGDVTLVAQWEAVVLTIRYVWKDTDITVLTETAPGTIGETTTQEIEPWVVGTVEDRHYGFVPTTSKVEKVLSADASQNVATVTVRLYDILEPTVTSLEYDGTEQTVPMKSYYGTVAGYTAVYGTILTGPAGKDVDDYSYMTIRLSTPVVDTTDRFVAYERNSYTIEIDRKPITVTAQQNATRKYGEENPAFTYTVEGLVEGETLTGALSTEATAESIPGDYTITQGTLTNLNNPNYRINFVPGKLTVTQAKVSTPGPITTSLTCDSESYTMTVSAGSDSVDISVLEFQLCEGKNDTNTIIDWTDDNVFTGLTPNTAYWVKYRLKETETTMAGNVCLCFSLTNKLRSDVTVSMEGWTYGDTPNTPAVTCTPNTLGEPTYLYESIDGGSYSSSEVPTNAGSYKLTATFENETHSGTASCEFTIAKATPTADHFTVTLPQNAEYNGEAQTATVTVKDGFVGMGETTVKYYTDAAQTQEAQPINAGTYYAYLTVAEGANYKATEAPIDLGSFTITAPIRTITYYIGDNTAAAAQLPQAQQLVVGASVPLPTLESDDNYRFDGWTLNGEKVDDTFTMPAQDIELVAAWKAFHTVTYDMGANTDATKPEAQRVAAGDPVPLPTLDPVGRYFFTTWWYDYKYYNSDNPLVMPDKDITVVAYWNPIHVIRNYRWKHTNLIAFAETTLLNSNENKDIFIGNTVTISPHLEMDGYRDDHALGIRASFVPDPGEKPQQLTISADLSKNELTFDCVLLIPIQPVSSELVYNGREQTVTQWKQADGDGSLLGGYTPDFSNYTFTVGTDVGTYKTIGEWDTIPVPVDKTGMFGARYLEFKEGLRIVRAPLTTAHLTLTPPSDPVYSGAAKTAAVGLASPYTGAGEFTVKYYTDAALTNEVQPINVGTYYVGVTAAEGDNFLAATEPVYAGNFTIAPKPITAPTAKTGLTFDWAEDQQTAVRHVLLDGFDATAMFWSSEGDNIGDLFDQNGVPVAFHAGTYNLSVTPAENHVWDEETPNRDAKEYSVTIAPKAVGASYYSNAIVKEYDGTADFNGSFDCLINGAFSMTVTGGRFDSKDAGNRTFIATDCEFSFADETHAEEIESNYDCRRSDLNITLPDYDGSFWSDILDTVKIVPKTLRVEFTGRTPKTMELGEPNPFSFQLVSEEGNTFCPGEEDEINNLRLYFRQTRNDTIICLPYPDSVGTYYLRVAYPNTITADGKINDSVDANYTFAYPNGTTVTVTKQMPKAADFTVTNTSFTYTGRVQTPTIAKANDKDFGEVTYTFHKNGVQVDEPINAGTYTIKATNAGNSTYDATTVELGTFTIAKAIPTAEHFDFSPPTDLVFSGEVKNATVALKAPYTGLCEPGSSITVSYCTDESLQMATSPKAPMTYYVAITTRGGENFEATASRLYLGQFTIARKPVTVRAKNVSITYGDAVPTTFAYDVEGVIEKWPLVGALASTATQDSNAGTYDITQGTLQDNYNIYDITFHKGTLTIAKQKGPKAPSFGYRVENDGVTHTVTATPNDDTTGLEYRLDVYDATASAFVTGQWQDGNVFTGLAANTFFRLYARVAETANVAAGLEAFWTGNTGLLTGSGTVQLEGWTYGDTPNDPVVTSTTNGTDHVTYLYMSNDEEVVYESTEKPTAAGAYKVLATFAATATHDAVYEWCEFTIAKKSLKKPTAAAPYTYDGTEKAVALIDYDETEETMMAFQGVFEATDVGEYSVLICLLDPANYQWADGTTDVLEIYWRIDKASLAKPTVSGSYTYDTTVKTAVLEGYDSNTMTVGGTTEATNANTYEVTFALANTNNYQWADKTTDDVTGTWKINKAIPTAEHFTFTPPTDLEFSGEAKNATVEVKEGYLGMGSFEVSYRLNKEVDAAADPIDPATYYAGVKVTAPGANFDVNDSWVYLGEFTIEPKPITVTAKDKEITYGNAIPTTFAYEATGLVEGFPLVGSPATNATQGSNVGTYEITQGTLAAPNNRYSITFHKGTLTIDKANPRYTLPMGLTATYGDRLENVHLPDGWTWRYPDENVGNAGVNAFRATFTPGDTTNYNTVDEMLEITVSKKKLTKPTVTGEYTYDGRVQTVALTGFDSNTMRVVSGNTATNADSYTVTIALKDKANYQWVDGTTRDVKCTWTINKKPVEYPSMVLGGYTYDGTQKELNTFGFNEDWMTISGNTATDAGDYDVTIALKDKNNYQWTDGSTEDVKDTWTIDKASLPKPTVSGSYTYDTTVKTAVPNGFDGETMIMAGTTEATNANTYEVTFILADKDNYQWADGTDEDVKGTWSIAKASLAKPTISGSYIYDTSEKEVVLTGVDHATMEVTGTTKATNVSVYEVTIALTDKDNYQWADETTDDVTGTWKINKASLTKPTVSGSYIYDTSEKEAVLTGVDNANIKVAGTTKATNVGRYEVIIDLIDIANYQWADGTTSTVRGFWSITMASLTKPTVSGEYVYDTTEKTAVLTGFDSNTMIVKGNTATKAGTHTVTIGLKDKNSYCWADGTHEDFTGTFVIHKADLPKPEISGTYIYDNTEKSVVLGEGYDKTTMTVSGTQKTAKVGTYTVTIALKDTANYQWADGTSEPFSGTWTIDKASLPKPTISGSFVYSGKQYKATIGEDYNETLMTLRGTTRATEAGTYRMSIVLRNTATHQWEDGTTEPVTGTWVIRKASLDRPVISGDYPYTGKEIQPALSGFDSSLMKRGGDWKATNAGDHTMTIALRDTDNFQWKDGTTEPMLGTWHIVAEAAEETAEDTTISTEVERMGITLYEATGRMAEDEDATVELLYAAEALTPALYQRLKALTPQEQMMVVLTTLLGCGDEVDYACQLNDTELSPKATKLMKDITNWMERMDETTRARFEQDLATWFIRQTITDGDETYQQLTLQWLITTDTTTTLEKYTFTEKDGVWVMTRYEQIVK